MQINGSLDVNQQGLGGAFRYITDGWVVNGQGTFVLSCNTFAQVGLFPGFVNSFYIQTQTGPAVLLDQ